jgi:hypothetical protein
MVDLEWDPNYVPKVKLGLHSAQILFSFVLWCLAIAVFTSKDADIVGNNGWTFGVCFLSIPAWVYLIMTPRWERTRKFAQPHAMLLVDCIFAVIWLSAFATQAAYNSSGRCGEGCKLSGAVVGLGVVVFLLFCASSFVSAYCLQFYNFHGTLPGYDARQIRGGENIDPDKAAFSMAPHDEEAYERVNMDDHEASGSGYGAGADAEPYGSTSGGYGAGAGAEPYGSTSSRYGHADPYNTDDRYGGMPPSNNTMFDSETEYGGASAYSGSTRPPTYNDEPAQFPTGNYERGLR